MGPINLSYVSNTSSDIWTWNSSKNDSGMLFWRRTWYDPINDFGYGEANGGVAYLNNALYLYSYDCYGYGWNDYFYLNLSNGLRVEFFLSSVANWVCLAKDTYVVVIERDGATGKKRKRRKRIQEITYDDDILVWDFDKREFAVAKPLWLAKKQETLQYNVLRFSDGTELKTVGQHRIFNKEKGKFTYPFGEETPIGTTTINSNGEEIKLVSRETVYQYVEYYNIITEYHMNVFANGILTSCRLSNLYPIEDMKYIKDNRELVSKEEYKELPEEYYYGLRLSEQPKDINRDNANLHGINIIEYVKNMIKIAKDKDTDK